jgi:uncharacterized protein YecT (DUF1311 family)
MKNKKHARSFYGASVLASNLIQCRLILINFALLSLCLFSTNNYAAEPIPNRCIDSGVKLDYACTKLEYDVHTKRLRAALHSVLNLGHVNKEMIQKQQARWAAYRNKICSQKDEASFSFSYWQHCLANLTNSRANEIEKIVDKKP